MSTTPERESRTLHQKKPQIDRIHEGYPPKNSGYEGEIRLHFIKGDGLRLYVRRAKNWHYTSLSTTGTTSTTTTVSSGGGSGDITSVTAGTGLSGGGTTGAVTLTNAGVTSNVAGTGINVNAATGAVTISVSGLTVSELAANSLQTSGESFSDNDTSLMTSAAIQDKIQSFSYITLSSLSASAPITYNNSSGAFSIADHAVALTKLPEIATARFLGRTSSSTGDVEVLTVGQVGTLLSLDTYLTAPRTITAGGNTLASSETLAFTAGSNVTISESGGSVTIAATDTNTTDLSSLSAGVINTSNDSFGFIDADDSNASKKESIADFLTAIAGSGISASSGQLNRDSIALGGLSNVSSSSPSTGDFLKYGGSQWEPTAVSVMTGWKLRDSSSASNDKTVSEGKFVKIVAANSGSYGDVAFSGSTGATDDPFVVSISAPNTDRYVNAASFNTGDGVLTLTRAGSDSATVTVDLDGRFLSTLSGQRIDNLLDVGALHSGGGSGYGNISNGQVLVWNSTASAFQPGSSSYSWYLRDGDTTAVEVTSGKYVKLVEGTGIDINFTDTDSGAVDDEFDVTITNTLMSGGNISGTLTTTDNLGVGISSPTTHYEKVIHVHESSGSSAVHLTNATTGSTENDGTDMIAYQDDFYIWNRESGGHVIIGTNATERFKLESGGNAYFTGDIYVNKSSPYLQLGNGGNTTSSSIRIGGDNSAGGRLYLQYNGDSSYIDVYGGHGSTERYRDLVLAARSFTFKTSAAASATVAFQIDSSQNIYLNNAIIGSNHTLSSESNSHFQIKSANSAAVGVKLSANGNLRAWIYANDSSEYGFLDTSGNWDLRKTHNSHLLVYGSGSNYAKFGSGDEWGRIEFNDFSNGTYVYLNQGDFRVDGGNWNPYSNATRNLGSDSLRWSNLYVNSTAQVGELKLNNDFKWQQGSSDYGKYTAWLQSSGGHGLWFPGAGLTSNPHFYPVTSSYNYGTFRVEGGQSSWTGFVMDDHSSRPTLMHDGSHGGGGLYYQGSSSWAHYWDVGNACFGIDGSTTSSSYSLYVGGGIYSTGDVVAFSDARVKTNVVTIDNPLDKVLNMRGVYYNPIDKETKEVDDRRRVGVIAQELNKVLPEAVTYAEDVDEYGVDYGKLTGVLIEAIKELKQEINELKGI